MKEFYFFCRKETQLQVLHFYELIFIPNTGYGQIPLKVINVDF